jgi:hypothetical protein
MAQEEKRPTESKPNTSQPKTGQSSGTQGQDARRTTFGQEAKKTTQNTGGSDPNKRG